MCFTAKPLVTTVVARVRTRLGQPRVAPEESAVLRQMLRTYDHYRDRLYTCYDHPDLPRTTGELERDFGSMRCHERRVRAHTSTSRTPRDGRFIAAAISELKERGPIAPHELARVPEEVRRKNLADMALARNTHERPRMLRSNLDRALARIASYPHGIARRKSASRPAAAGNRQMMRC